MDMEFATKIDGTDKGEIVLFTLSTCGWCYKTKTLLNQLGVRYSYIDVDLLDDTELEKANRVLRRYTSRTAYPAIIIDQKECIIGYDPDRLQELFGN